MKNEYNSYKYNGFTIWSGDGETWIASPDWIVDANENYNFLVENDCDYFQTIKEAKQWVKKYKGGC